MFWILIVMAALVSIVIAILVGGLATPRHHVASRAIVLAASPARVWEVVRSIEQYPEWRDDVQSIDVLPGVDGQFHWREVGRRGSVGYVATADQAPSNFRARITDEDLPYSGEWEWNLEPLKGGTRLVITERGDVSNPIFRFIGRYFIGHDGTINSYLQNLAMHLGETAKPVAADTTAGR